MKRWITLSLLLGLGLVPLSNSFAAGFIIVEPAHWWWPEPPPPRPIPPPRPPRWPPPPPPRTYVFAPLEVRYVKVNTRINDQVAVTSIDQEFYNPNPSQLEGTFVFPIPKGAHIDKFTMEIDGKQVEAELLNAEKARRIYEDIVRRAKDPALLEYAERGMFKLRIFPIEGHGKKRIRLSYTELLKSDDGLIGYHFPLGTEKFAAKPIRDVSVKVELESKRPLKSVYSPSHSVEVRREGTYRAVAGYEGSDVQPDTDFSLYYSPEKDEIGVNLMTYRRSGEDGYFVLLTSPGVSANEKQVVLKDVAFVVDTSGSMAGKKLEQAKKALQFCVENLNPRDHFEIIRFSTEVEPIFDGLVEATRQNRDKARDFIEEMKPIGGTAIDDALRKALALRPKRDSNRPFVVIFLTDGRPTIGTTDEDEIVAGVKRRGETMTRIFCFGIGLDVNTHLLDRITEQTRAFSQYVLPDEDLEVKVSSFFTKIKEPVLAEPTLKFTGDVRTTKIYPSPLPDLFKGEQVVVVGRYSGQGDSAVVLEGTVNGETKKFTHEVTFDRSASEHEFIPRLWATRRVGYLLDEIRLRGENAELRDEVTELAREYGIVTPYTAYLIVEDEARRNVPTRMRSMQEFERDQAARDAAVQNWTEFKNESVGEKAVAGSRFGLALKSADAAAPAAVGGALESQRALGLSAPTVPGGAARVEGNDSKARLMEYAQQSRFMNGRNFFRNDTQWIDSLTQKYPNARRVRVKFDSKEYYELSRNTQALPWLALGKNVQFVLDDTLYEIHE